MTTSSKRKRGYVTGLVAAGALVASVTTLAGASPASATSDTWQCDQAIGLSIPKVPFEVGLPQQCIHLWIDGDNNYVNYVKAFYVGTPIDSWRIDFDFIDEHDNVYDHVQGKDQGDEWTVSGDDTVPIDGELPTGLVCARLIIRDQPALTGPACGHINSGLDWSFWD